jgi:hypothetical protein
MPVTGAKRLLAITRWYCDQHSAAVLRRFVLILEATPGSKALCWLFVCDLH